MHQISIKLKITNSLGNIQQPLPNEKSPDAKLGFLKRIVSSLYLTN